MGQVHHGSATTTAAARRAIQHSQESLRALAKRYGINQKTVAKWKKRTSVADLETGPSEATSTVLSIEEEAITIAFRRHTVLQFGGHKTHKQPGLCPDLAKHCIRVREGIVAPVLAQNRAGEIADEDLVVAPTHFASEDEDTVRVGVDRHCRLPAAPLYRLAANDQSHLLQFDKDSRHRLGAKPCGAGDLGRGLPRGACDRGHHGPFIVQSRAGRIPGTQPAFKDISPCPACHCYLESRRFEGTVTEKSELR